jgi:hypothetical protein
MGTDTPDIDRGGTHMGIGVVGILVVVLIVLAIIYFARRT